MTHAPPYRGRFAPTPSGPLHRGSLLTALLSWLDARAHNGQWLLRIDDLDTARCNPQHTATIQHQLEAHGLTWDGPVDYQSAALDTYESALQTLCEAGHCFACACTRKTLRASAGAGAFGPVYPGTCRASVLHDALAPDGMAVRMRAPDGSVMLDDDWRGTLRYDWQGDIGDVVLRRRDGIYGYALACAVDEARLGITHVVRGADLLAATPVHWHVLCCLGHTPPRSRHGPVLLRPDGAKLSKQNHARAIDAASASRNLYHCLQSVGIALDTALQHETPETMLHHALALWRDFPAAEKLGADIVTHAAD